MEKLLGDWLRNSEWIQMLINAEVTASGQAEAMLKGTHVTGTRYAHQPESFSTLRREAYLKYTKDYQENNNEIQSFEAWSNQKKNCRISSTG